MAHDLPHGNDTLRIAAFLVTDGSSAELTAWQLAHPNWFLAGHWSRDVEPSPGVPRVGAHDESVDSAGAIGADGSVPLGSASAAPTIRSSGRWGQLRPDYRNGVVSSSRDPRVDANGFAEGDAQAQRIAGAERLIPVLKAIDRAFNGKGSAAPVPVRPGQPASRKPPTAPREDPGQAEEPLPSTAPRATDRELAVRGSPEPTPDPATLTQRGLLRRRMVRAGELADGDPRQGHHIVPGGGKMSGNRDPGLAQRILRQYGIDIDSPENGVVFSTISQPSAYQWLLRLHLADEAASALPYGRVTWTFTWSRATWII